MKTSSRRIFAELVCIVTLLSVLTVNGQPSGCPTAPCTWNYFLPSTWGTVCDGQWALCATGGHQSPIDIDSSIVESSIELADSPVVLHYEEVYHTEVVNLGTTIHVDIGANNTLSGGPLKDLLQLTQLHFHAPGEHRINGAQSGAEVHLVHKSFRTGKTAAVVVVRVMSGTTNPWFNQIFTVRNLLPGANATIDINPLQVFPSSVLAASNHAIHSNYYYYNGSLTTPPCTEGIAWFVLVDPIYASNDQIDSLQRWEGINNRPIQPYNGTIFRPHFAVVTPVGEKEDIRYMGMVIGVSFLLGLVAFFLILAIAILALHCRDVSTKRDIYGAQQFELQPTSY